MKQVVDPPLLYWSRYMLFQNFKLLTLNFQTLSRGTAEYRLFVYKAEYSISVHISIATNVSSY